DVRFTTVRRGVTFPTLRKRLQSRYRCAPGADMRPRTLSPRSTHPRLALTALAAGAARPPAAAASPATPGTKDVVVHLFQWPWASVAQECTTTLGPKGFGAVQVSPPAEHVVLPGRGFPWWQ